VNNGKVTAVKAGSAAIKVITEDGSKTAECSVTVNAKVYPVTSVSLDKTSLTLTEGDVAQLTATVLPENASNKNVRWESTNTGVATVNNGKVTAVKAGSATIRVITEDGGKTAECAVTVQAKVVYVESLTMIPEYLTMHVGDKVQLQAVITPENATNKKVDWLCYEPEWATVDENGLVTALLAGGTTVRATALGTNGSWIYAESHITIIEKVYPVTSVSLDKTSLTLTEGDASQLTATVLPENASNKNVRWESTNTGVATVNNGKVTAVKAGSAAIKVITEDGNKTAECSVTVNAKVYPVTSVSLDKTSLTLTEGNIVQLTATVLPENATNKNVRWESTNTDVAPVNNGRVVAYRAGSATIKVITEDGNKTAECSVTVNAKVYPVTSVSLDKTTLTLMEGDVTQLTATVLPGYATNKNVRWESTNTGVATVSNGKVTAVKKGSAKIRVITEDGNKTAECDVTIKLKTVNGGFEGIGEEEW